MLTGTFFGFVNELKHIAEEPLSVIDMLANNLPQQANFFINYLLIRTVTGP